MDYWQGFYEQGGVRAVLGELQRFRQRNRTKRQPLEPASKRRAEELTSLFSPNLTFFCSPTRTGINLVALTQPSPCSQTQPSLSSWTQPKGDPGNRHHRHLLGPPHELCQSHERRPSPSRGSRHWHSRLYHERRPFPSRGSSNNSSDTEQDPASNSVRELHTHSPRSPKI